MDVSTVFSLNKQIYAKIPKEHLKVPSGSGTLILTPEDAEIRLLGYEKDETSGLTPKSSRKRRKQYKGTLLISYEGYKGKVEMSYIGIYGMGTKNLESFSVPGLSNFVSATLRYPFLIFTQLEKSVQQYSSFLLSLDEQEPVVKPLFPPSFCYEKIHLMSSRHFIQFRESTIKEQNTQANARVYELTTEMTSTLQRSYGNPSKYIWIDWDVHTKRIYFLEKNAETLQNLLSDLIIVPLSRGKIETPLHTKKNCTMYIIDPRGRVEDLTFQVAVDLTETISAKDLRTNYDFRILPVFAQVFTVVRLGEDQYCLCEQHSYVKDSSFIKVTLHWLNRDQDVTIKIPISRLTSIELPLTRVFFGAIHDMLLIYIPNIFVYLLDGSSHHGLYPSILLSDANDFSHSTSQITASMMSRLHCQLSTSEETYLIFDGHNGICYDADIGRPWIVQQFSKTFMKKYTATLSNRHLLSQAIHFAMFHVGEGHDDELFLQIISMIFLGRKEGACDYIDTDLLKEVLVCYVYNETQKIKGYDNLLSVLPLTAVPTVEQGDYPLCELSFSPRDVTANGHQVQRIPVHLNLYAKGNAKMKTSMGSFSKQLPKSTHNIFAVTCSHLVREFVLDKKQANKVATAYCYLLMNTVEVIYQEYIVKGRREEESNSQYFRLLSNFYSALEELSYPIVGSFSHDFACLSFEFLPRMQFYQYLDRDVFNVNKAFLKFLLPKLTGCKEDRALKCKLLSLVERDVSFDFQCNDPEYAQHIFELLVNQASKFGVATKAQRLPKEPFLPMKMLQQSLFTEENYSLRTHFDANSNTLLLPLPDK